MDTHYLVIPAIVALLAGLALFGFDLLKRQQGQRQQSRVIERALQTPQQRPAPGAKPSSDLTWQQQAAQWLATLGARFENSRLGKALITPEDILLLGQINRNSVQGRAAFLGLRIALAMLMPIPALLWFQPSGGQFLLVVICALAFGLLLPKFALNAWAKRLRKQANDELPLLIDLLRLLQGVGFSVDQSLQVIADRFRPIMPLLSREIGDANLTYSHGRTREQSLQRLRQFNNDGLQSLVQILLQVHEHGGAVQEPLRQFGERLREQRKAEMKEASGKLSVKMTLVMMLTLLPALMLVLSGPAIVSLIETMARLKAH